jgi:hypothetical protein
MKRRFLPLLIVTLALGVPLAGCDLGGDTAEKIAAQREAEGKAVGGACRHAGRAIEDCFALNKRAEKAAVFAGWREMNDYMRENKIEPVAPTLTALTSAGSRGGSSAHGEAGGKAAAPAEAEAKPKSASKKHES